jgi:hypothetical protein
VIEFHPPLQLLKLLAFVARDGVVVVGVVVVDVWVVVNVDILKINVFVIELVRKFLYRDMVELKSGLISSRLFYRCLAMKT